MAKTTMQLEQLTCPNCVKQIETALAKTAGIEKFNVSLETGKLDAEFDDSQISTENIKGIIEKLGFDVLSVL